MQIAYTTNQGSAYIGDSLRLIKKLQDNSVNLVITSPPFALLRQKEYGNKNGEEYINWLTQFAEAIMPKLTNDGSFVIDLGGAYQKGKPIRSLYNYKVLIKFCDELGYKLAEEFFWYNSSKLPSPIEWVNKRKIRAKDSVNTVWWFSKGDFPKANIKNVLVPYSDRINYPRINSGVCSSHSFWNSDLNAFRLSPARLHHRAVDDARLSAKIYSADACLLNCGASSPLRYSVPKNWMFIDASRSSFDL